jgi:hypothetical protein
VRREQCEGLPASACALRGVAADEPHEDGHQGQGQQHEACRDEIDRRDEGDHSERDRRCEHELREVAREQRLESIDAPDRGRRDLGALSAVERGAAVTEPPLDDFEPKPREHGVRRSSSDGFEAPCSGSSCYCHSHEQDERQGQLREVRPAERAGGDPSDQDRLREDE